MLSAYRVVTLKVTPLLLIYLISTCCVSSSIIPDSNRINSIKSIEVVAIEPPPLTITAESMRYALGSSPIGNDPGSKPLAVISGIVLLVNLQKYNNTPLPIASMYHNILSEEHTWIPTVELGKYAVYVFKKSGLRKVELKPGYSKLPEVKNRAATVFMENWYAPIRSWYNDNSSITPYNQYTDQLPDTYLEIGICNYELMNDKLLLQVMVKLIDSKTNITIGKTRNYELVDISQGKNLMIDNGKKFKEIFYSTGGRLIDKSIKELNL